MTSRQDWEERRESWIKRPDDYRTQYEVDLGRIIHSTSFRRLGAVTQVISGEGSLQRTRLTHSLEVQQISEGIVQRFRGREDIPEVLRTHLEDGALNRSIALVHDLGHPPFGHAGEEALNCMMRDRGEPVRDDDRDHGLNHSMDLGGTETGTAAVRARDHGFEGNGQTLRILSRLEDFSSGAGSNLTRRALLGTLKYPVPYSQALKRPIPPPVIGETGIVMVTERDHAPPKCYMDTERDVVAWLLAPLGDEARLVVEQKAKSVDATIMDASDDLAYSIADLNDAVMLGLITREELMEDVPGHMWDDYLEYTAQRGKSQLYGETSGHERVVNGIFGGSRSLQRETGRLMGYGMARVEVRSRTQFRDPLYAHEVAIAPQALKLVEAIKSSILERVILSPRLQHGRLVGQGMLIKVFDVMRTDPRHHLPEKQYRRYLERDRDDRVICDWLAGASEMFVTKLHERLFMPGGASVTDRL